MSVETTAWAMYEAKATGVNKLALIYISDANRLLTVEEVAALAGVGVREAQSALRGLDQTGELRWVLEWQDRENEEARAVHRLRSRVIGAAISGTLRTEVIARDGLICQLCAGAVIPSDLSIDHKIPRSKGGPTALANLQVAHRRCNSAKGDRTPEHG